MFHSINVPTYGRNETNGQLCWRISSKSTEPTFGNKTNPSFPRRGGAGTSTQNSLLGVDTIHIIDGQQRLTTLQYILASIRLSLRATGLSELEGLVLTCLKNTNEATMRNKR